MNPCHTHIFIIDSFGCFFFFSLSSKSLGMHLSESNWNANVCAYVFVGPINTHTDTTYHILTNFFANFPSLSYFWCSPFALFHLLLSLADGLVFFLLLFVHMVWPQCVLLQIENANEMRREREMGYRSSIWNLYICKLFFFTFCNSTNISKLFCVFLPHSGSLSSLSLSLAIMPINFDHAKNALLSHSLAVPFQINRQNKNRFFIIHAIYLNGCQFCCMSMLLFSRSTLCVCWLLLVFPFWFLNNRKNMNGVLLKKKKRINQKYVIERRKKNTIVSKNVRKCGVASVFPGVTTEAFSSPRHQCDISPSKDTQRTVHIDNSSYENKCRFCFSPVANRIRQSTSSQFYATEWRNKTDDQKYL